MRKYAYYAHEIHTGRTGARDQNCELESGGELPAANFQQRKWEDDPDEMERFMAGGQ